MKSHLNNLNNQMLQMKRKIKILHQNAMKCKCRHPLHCISSYLNQIESVVIYRNSDTEAI